MTIGRLPDSKTRRRKQLIVATSKSEPPDEEPLPKPRREDDEPLADEVLPGLEGGMPGLAEDD
jgi:hypothetical protein